MSGILRSRVRTTQPQQAVGINWSNPMSSQLLMAAVGGIKINLISGASPILAVGSLRTIVSEKGVALTSNSSSDYHDYAINYGPEYTIVNYGVSRGGSGISMYLDDDNSSSSRKFQFRTNQNKVEFIPFSGTSYIVVNAAGDIAVPHVAVATITSTGNVSVFYNKTKSTGTLGGVPNSGTSVRVGGFKGGGQYLNGDIYLQYVFNRALSDVEVFSIVNNPWQIFAPEPRRIFSIVSGGLISLSGVVVGASPCTANSAFTLFQTGASGTLTAGTPTPNTTVQNVGSATTLATGTTSVSATRLVSGISAATSAGVITYVLSGVAVALGGVALSSVSGVTTVSVACTAVGVPIALTAGTPISTNTKSVAGSALSAVIGSLISVLNLTLPPQQSVLSNGTLTYVLAGLSGLIVEGSAIDTWVISVSMCADNTSAGTVTSTGATYSLSPTQQGIARVTCSPKVDYSWTASRTATAGDFCVGINPLNLFRCTTGGTTGTVEPSWPTSGTISDNSAVWTFVAPLVNPITKLMVI